MSYRTDIKDAIKAVLEASADLSSATILSTLDRKLTGDDMPAVVIYTLASRRGSQSFSDGLIPREVVVAIEAAVLSTPTDAENDAEDLATKIEDAMEADRSLGNVVHHCEWQETVTDVNSEGSVTLGVVLLQYLVTILTNPKQDGAWEFSDDGFTAPPTEVYTDGTAVDDAYAAIIGDDVLMHPAVPAMETESACQDGSCAIPAWMGDADGFTGNPINLAPWVAMASGANNTVNAVCADESGNVYAGGSFTSIGGVAVSRVGMWDGLAWSAMGAGLGAAPLMMRVDNDGNVIAVGNLLPPTEWDGESWSAIAGYPDATARDVAFFGSVMYVAGTTGVHRYESGSWTTIGTFTGSRKYCAALAIDSVGNLYVGGNINQINGDAVANVAMWDGAAWIGLGTGFTEAFINVWSIAVDSTDNVYFSGDFTVVDGVPINSIAKWNGTAWSAVGSVEAYCVTVTVDANDDVWTGGYWYDDEADSVRRLDGNDFVKVGGDADSYINVMADGAGNVYVGGNFQHIRSTPLNRIAQYQP